VATQDRAAGRAAQERDEARGERAARGVGHERQAARLASLDTTVEMDEA
jgi:hypothetical protein